MTSRLRAHPLVFATALLLVAVLAVLAMLWGLGVVGGAAQQSPAGNAALAYARARTVWYSGPVVQSVRTVPLDRLQGALRASVPAHIQQDVNIPALIRQYGPHRQVALVVLNGSYNSLPPDEGVTVHGDWVAIVDARTNRVLLLTD
jgi:hypothetical protein